MLKRVTPRYVVAAVAAAVFLAACSGSPSGSAASSAGASTSVATTAVPSAPASAPTSSTAPTSSSSGNASAADLNPCSLVTIDQVKALYPGVTQSNRPARAECHYQDARPTDLVTIVVRQGGTAMDALGKENTALGFTNHPLSGVGEDAAYRLYQPAPNKPASLAAVAAVKGGWRVEILLLDLPDSAPGQPGFTRATGLLTAAIGKL